MLYATVAIDAPVEGAFDYHAPPELAPLLQVGQLVQVQFRTATQNAIIIALHEQTPEYTTKPILTLLDPRPVVNAGQIVVSQWMAEHYLAPLGACLWLWLPPGLTGHHDVIVDLAEPPTGNGRKDDLENSLLTLLERRGALRGHQLDHALAGKPWREAADSLAKAGLVVKSPTLTPPRVKPKIVQTAALAIHPDEITRALKGVARTSRAADVIECLAAAPDGEYTVETLAKAVGLPTSQTRVQVQKLVDEATVVLSDIGRLDLLTPRETVPELLAELRKTELPARILRVLARHSGPVDVSWVYAQTGASLNDLRRLEEEDLLLLGEKQHWRDSLADTDFVPAEPPLLSFEQAAAWEPLRRAIEMKFPPPAPEQPPTPEIAEKAVEQALPIADLVRSLARQRREQPTEAEQFLWQHIGEKQLGYRVRRQHTIERFIVDFLVPDVGLIVEVDGDEQFYTPEDEAVRQAFLEERGFAVVRFTDDQVMYDLEMVVDQLRYEIEEAEAQEDNEEEEQLAPPVAEPKRVEPIPPQVSQPEATPEIIPTTFLLHGVTGSGKTELYLRAIDEMLKRGKSAIFLVPEIALTPQTARRVAERFPGQAAIVHSGLSAGERYDTWRRAREGLIRIVVGARSALFTPLQNLGLIILDEEHDHSYKQSPPFHPPYYHARAVAQAMMEGAGGMVMLGSATPEIETTFAASQGAITRLDLPNRIMGHRVRIEAQAERAGVLTRYETALTAPDAVTIDLPPVQVIDMREELKAGNVSIFSRELHSAIKETLRKEEQVILFLNRRGQATYVFCRDCGYVVRCPRCDTPLTYHRHDESLHCHRCDFHAQPPTICPQCNSRRIKYFGAGTQQVEAALHEQFPGARVIRWDADTARGYEEHDAILQRFINRQADILIGTQVVTKGLDLPLVTLVGVISADIGLGLPDFRAGERTFQVLTQVAGRAGRGLLGGRAIFQTYQPEHYAIAAAAHHNYAAFYLRELAYRRDLGYPPFRKMVRIEFRFNNEAKARAEAERAANLLRQRLKVLGMTGTEIIGPAPCFFGKENNVYRWHLLLRGPDPSQAAEGLDPMVVLARYDQQPGWYVDVDPVEVL